MTNKIFWVKPNCKWYQEDGNCYLFSKPKEKYGCNEFWCFKKIREEELLKKDRNEKEADHDK